MHRSEELPVFSCVTALSIGVWEDFAQAFWVAWIWRGDKERSTSLFRKLSFALSTLLKNSKFGASCA